MGSQVGIARPTRAGLWQMTLDIEKKEVGHFYQQLEPLIVYMEVLRGAITN